MRDTERVWETERERERSSWSERRGRKTGISYRNARQKCKWRERGPTAEQALLGAEAPTVGVGPSAGRGMSSPRRALDAGAGTSHIPHLLPICIPLMVDLHPQAFSPDPQSIQNKPWLFIRSCKSAQTSAALLGPVGPHRHKPCQSGTRGGEWVQKAEKGSLWRRDGSPLALPRRGLRVLAKGLSGGTSSPPALPGPSPEAAPGVLAI